MAASDEPSTHRRDAVMFLAAIIPRKEKEKIRLNLEKESHTTEEGLSIVFLGINIRNALRMGGFPFDSMTLDYIWYDLLKEAIYLPEDNLRIFNSVKEAIQKYKAKVKFSHEVKHEKHLVRFAVMALILLIISIILQNLT